MSDGKCQATHAASYRADGGGNIGNFKSDDKEQHVAPCDNEGLLLEPHSLHQHCICGPARKVYREHNIWVHETLNGKGTA
jgi:hypothetical protein